MRHSLLTPIEAAHRMRDGEVIAYPTEAVYGLGCDPARESAVQRILALKQRPVTMGMILIGSDFEQFGDFVDDSDPAPALATWPGPVTWLFPRGPACPPWVCGEHETVAIRVTDHPECRALCEAFGGAVVSTSANPHSAPAARTAVTVETYFGHTIGGIVAGGLGGRESCSEIRDLATGDVRRSG